MKGRDLFDASIRKAFQNRMLTMKDVLSTVLISDMTKRGNVRRLLKSADMTGIARSGE